MPRAGAGYPYNFGVSSKIFKDDEFETEAETNSRHPVCPLFVRGSLLAHTELAHSPLFAHYVNTRTRTNANI